MSKSNPYAKARKIIGTVFVCLLGGIGALGFTAILIGSIVVGLQKGAPWYEVFAFPLTILVVAVVFAVVAYVSIWVSYWWRERESKWEKENGG